MVRIIWRGAFASVAVLALTAVPASAGSPVAPAARLDAPGLAVFEGKTINLAEGWGRAQACVVWRAKGAVECFASEAAMTRREGQLSLSAAGVSVTASVAGSCSSPLRLYENTWYGGRQLAFWDYGYWQNLADYGFDNQLSSYKIGSCYAHLAESAWGGGWWYPGNTGPFYSEPVMSSGWNDRVSSIYNE
jgi:hypothetical protein